MDFTTIKLKPFQDKFVFSDKKMVAVVSGVGSGKSLSLLLKAHLYANAWPGSTILIIRKSYSDLVRSTQADWEKFFDCKVPSDGCFKFPNGSQAFFMHSGETGDFSAIKSINAAAIFCDQAEELSLENINHFMTRLRQNNGAPVRPLVLCANSNGHNWLWRMFVAGAQQVNILDPVGDQREYLSEDKVLYTATTFVNTTLPPDYIQNLKTQEQESPNFFKRMVLNSFEEEIAADLVFPMLELEKSKKIDFKLREGYGLRILGCDPADVGKDNSGLVIIQQMGALNWEAIYVNEWQGKEGIYTVGKTNETAIQMRCSQIVIDSQGLGAPISSFLSDRGPIAITNFRNTPYGVDADRYYGNARTKYAFLVKKMINDGHLKITDEKLIKELNEAFRFKYTTAGEQRILISKEKMRSEGVASPGLGDALIMAVSVIADVQGEQARQYGPIQPQYSSPDWNPFAEPRDTGGRNPQYSGDGDLFKISGV